MVNKLSEKLDCKCITDPGRRYSEGSSGRVAGSFTPLRKSFREKRLSSGGGGGGARTSSGGSADPSRENTPVGSLNITGK